MWLSLTQKRPGWQLLTWASFFGYGILFSSCTKWQCELTWLPKKKMVEGEQKKTKEERMFPAVVVQ